MEDVYDLFVHHLLYCGGDLHTANQLFIRLLTVSNFAASIEFEEYFMILFMKASSESTHSKDDWQFCHDLRYDYWIYK
jgi:hypothetical protein